jgi:hypothetical protein
LHSIAFLASPLEDLINISFSPCWKLNSWAPFINLLLTEAPSQEIITAFLQLLRLKCVDAFLFPFPTTNPLTDLFGYAFKINPKYDHI